MRGRPSRTSARSGSCRTTPAHAGKTSTGPDRGTEPGDHPRACGEDRPIVGELPVLSGPPPRMRGRHHGRNKHARRHRTTPAHAGKTRPADKIVCKRGDHPRACGEDEGFFWCGCFAAGPPPRMRGRRSSNAPTIPPRGTTPAHAGKTRTATLHTSAGPDHPRACGEDNSDSGMR